MLTATDGFTCPFCHLIFSLRTEFESHLRLEHPERLPAPPEQSTER